MEHICLDLEGVLVPEIWAEVAKHTGEDKFKLTTQDLKDYSELMDMRMDLVNSLNISLKDINHIVDSMEPFEGAMPNFAVGNNFKTACAKTCEVECRKVSRSFVN